MLCAYIAEKIKHGNDWCHFWVAILEPVFTTAAQRLAGLYPAILRRFPLHTSVWQRKISLSDGKKPRPSGILRL